MIWRMPASSSSSSSLYTSLLLCLSNHINGYFQIHGPILLGRRHGTIPQIHLQRRKKQFRRTQLGISSSAKFRKGFQRRFRRQLFVGLLFRSNRRLPGNVPSARAVIVTDKDEGMIGTLRVKTLYALVQGFDGTSRKVAAGRSHVGHEERVAGKYGVVVAAHEEGNASGGMAGCMEDSDGSCFAQLKGLTVS
mmetsp:Transcript_19564/g.30141  ORF Transcript_19564/g.30141 Transcript_19564/m.30141 type:complete len:192 (+) Transcript_19564:86-661(+)